MPTAHLDRRHARYLEQAAWTAELRQRLLHRVPTGARLRVLDVGAGTGVIAGEISAAHPHWRVFALDLDWPSCRFGRNHAPSAVWQCGDAQALPFDDASFDSALFHFVLLWVEDPPRALSEAVRVTRSEGWVAAMAEPDHAARLDFPDALTRLGERQTESLGLQGADVRLGRKLRALFVSAGLLDVEAGVLGGVWDAGSGDRIVDSEWRTLRDDLQPTMSSSDLEAFEALDRQAWSRGERILFVPTFYAIGRVG